MTTKIPVELSSTPSIVDNGDATAITISSNENVLIGSSTEIATNIGLQITGSNAAGFMSLFRDDSSVVANDDLGGILFYGDDNNATTQFAYIRATAEGTHADGDNPTAIRFGTTADGSESVTERMRIDSAGRVLVGNTDGLAKFCVGNGSGNALIEMASSSATAVYYEHINRSNVSGNCNVGYYARAAGEHTFYTGSYTARFIINSSGGSNASDKKLKENIQNLSYGLDTVKSLKPRQFKWKDNQQQSIGFVAQEVESLIPEVVSEVSADIKAGTDEKIKALNYANLTAVLTKAIQEQQAIIEDLQTQINEVKNGN